MKEYILAVCGAVILSALALILLPEGKTGKMINGMLKLFCLLVMLVPLLAMFREGGSIVNIFQGEEAVAQPDAAFVEYMFARRAEQEEGLLEADVYEAYGVQAYAEIEWESIDYAFTVRNVQVKIQDFGIYGEDEHIIIIEQIEERVGTRYEGAEVSVYG